MTPFILRLIAPPLTLSCRLVFPVSISFYCILLLSFLFLYWSMRAGLEYIRIHAFSCILHSWTTQYKHWFKSHPFESLVSTLGSSLTSLIDLVSSERLHIRHQSLCEHCPSVVCQVRDNFRTLCITLVITNQFVQNESVDYAKRRDTLSPTALLTMTGTIMMLLRTRDMLGTESVTQGNKGGSVMVFLSFPSSPYGLTISLSMYRYNVTQSPMWLILTCLISDSL